MAGRTVPCCGKSNQTSEKRENLFSSVYSLLQIIRVGRFRPYLLVGRCVPTWLFVSLHHKKSPEFTTKKGFCQIRECARTRGTMSEEVFQEKHDQLADGQTGYAAVLCDR